MKTLPLSPDLLFIYVFIFSGNQMQYLSHNLCLFRLVIRCSRSWCHVRSCIECSGMIISQDLQTGVSDFAG